MLENGLDMTGSADAGCRTAAPGGAAAFRLPRLAGLAEGRPCAGGGLQPAAPATAALTIYGSETAFPDYAAQVRALAAPSQHPLRGPLDHRHVGAALRQMDCLVVPSVWYENSPLVIQEALRWGCR